MKVFFIVPDYDSPSWGIGMLYHLANMTHDIGLSVSILKLQKNLKKPLWIDCKAIISSLPSIKHSLSIDDIFIVPEVMVTDKDIVNLPGRKICLIQGSVLIPIGLKTYEDYQSLGYERVITTMPHISHVVQSFWPIDTSIISPFVADYFFESDDVLDIWKRKRQILLFPKPGYTEAGYFDYQIALNLLTRKILEINDNTWEDSKKWKVIEIRNLSHKEVAKLMAQSCFLVNTNCFESFNATVPEAMATGCIPFCYEAFGGKDFLIDEMNAFVFRNNYIYPMLNGLISIVKDFENEIERLLIIQDNGIATAMRYTKKRTKVELIAFYNKMGLLH